MECGGPSNDFSAAGLLLLALACLATGAHGLAVDWCLAVGLLLCPRNMQSRRHLPPPCQYKWVTRRACPQAIQESRQRCTRRPRRCASAWPSSVESPRLACWHTAHLTAPVLARPQLQKPNQKEQSLGAAAERPHHRTCTKATSSCKHPRRRQAAKPRARCPTRRRRRSCRGPCGRLRQGSAAFATTVWDRVQASHTWDL